MQPSSCQVYTQEENLWPESAGRENLADVSFEGVSGTVELQGVFLLLHFRTKKCPSGRSVGVVFHVSESEEV